MDSLSFGSNQLSKNEKHGFALENPHRDGPRNTFRIRRCTNRILPIHKRLDLSFWDYIYQIAKINRNPIDRGLLDQRYHWNEGYHKAV